MKNNSNDRVTFRSARIRILGIGLVLGLIFVFFSGYLAYRYMGETRQQRLNHLKQTVEIAVNTIEPILVAYRDLKLSESEALDKIRDLVRQMVFTDHTGRNYIFMSAYDGTMLVQPFEPEKEMTDMWDLKDANGTYIIQALIKAAKTGGGFVAYYYQRPGREGPEEKVSYVKGIPDLGCYIGTGQYMADLRKAQLLYIINTAVLSGVMLVLLIILVRSSMAEMKRQNRLLLKENESLKLTEEALRNSEGKYRELLEQSPIGLVLSRMDGRLVNINPAFAAIVGYPLDKAQEISLFAGPSDPCGDADRQQLEQLSATGRYGPYEKVLVHQDGHRVPVRLSGMRVTRENEVFIWSSVEDISPLAEAQKEKGLLEERLRQAQKMEAIGTLAGGIAHDFNNILFPILGHTEMLLEDVEKGSEVHKSLEKIYNSSLRAKGLVRQILTFSRQEKSEYRFLKVQVIIKEALQLIRSTMPTYIEIRQDIQTDCSPVKADPTQVHQIIMNLTTNAYHAMEPRGGELSVSLRQTKITCLDPALPELRPGTYVCLTVSDQGVGMERETAQKIFDPFFTTKELGKGTGMGLSVVHGIIRKMKGHIRVESVPGMGSTFTVFFPVEAGPAKQADPPVPRGMRGGSESILLVDDEPAIIEMERRMLTRLGYRVTACTSSIEALEIFRTGPDKFDMVITDMAMPRLPGDRFAADLVLIRPDIPVLLLTGFSGILSEEEAVAIGIRGFLLKPVIMKELAAKVRNILDPEASSPGADRSWS